MNWDSSDYFTELRCDSELHKGLQEIGENFCPCCELQFNFVKKTKYYLICCDKQDIINDNGQLVCQNCGIVQGFKYAKEYVGFYENRHRFRKKSVYERKYCINNRLLDIQCNYQINLTCQDQIKIKKIFSEIGKILDEVNGTRKRLISINFIFHKVLNLMNIPCEKIPISELAKTKAFHEKYWSTIMSLIGDKILAILQ